MIQLLSLLIVVHFVVDYQFQSDFVALNKNWRLNKTPVPWYYVMLSHACCHALPIWYLVSPFAAAFELAAHFAIDCLKCAGYTNIHVDQALHLMCKGFIVLTFFSPAQ